MCVNFAHDMNPENRTAKNEASYYFLKITSIVGLFVAYVGVNGRLC